MDKQLIENIKKIYLGIAIYDIIVLIVLAIISKFDFSTVGGLIAGSIVSMIALFLLAKNIEALVDKEKTKASFFAVFGYLIRFAMYAAVLVYAATTKNINVYTVAVGLISTSIVIRVQGLILKKKHRKED